MNHRTTGGSLLETTGGSGGLPVAHKNDLIGKIMISAIAILFAIVLLILILHFYVRWHVLRRAARRARRLRRLIFARDGQAPPASHAVDPAVLKSLPALLFSADGGDDDELKECSVCLNEFEEGEKIRRLPRCAHSFHIDCIDMWFSSHSSCPLCRAAVEAISTAADSPSVTDLCSSCQREELLSSSSSDSTAGEVVIDIPAGLIEGLGGEAEGVDLGRRQALMWRSSRVLCLIWRSLTLDIWRKRVDELVTEPELDGREAVPPPATSPPAPTE